MNINPHTEEVKRLDHELKALESKAHTLEPEVKKEIREVTDDRTILAKAEVELNQVERELALLKVEIEGKRRLLEVAKRSEQEFARKPQGQ